jgi:iron complex outermembrane receptor protein
MKNKLICAALTGASLLVLAMPAAAQDAPAAQNEDVQADSEIVVTAQKRTERLQDVPLSITVANQEQLERQQVNTISDLTRVAPSLEMQSAPGQSVGGGGQIRGIGTQSFNQGAVGSVGIVVDGVSQGNANIADLFDIARVEVLKGPQGTLFGLTTSAGVINISTTAPEFDKVSFRARTELSAAGKVGSEYGRQLAQAVVNLPLGSNVAIRVAGNLNLTQGSNRNAYTDKFDAHRTYGVRGRLLWEPTPELTVNLIGDYTKVDDDGVDFFVLWKASPAVKAEAASCGVTPSQGNRDYCTREFPPFTKSTTWGGSLQLDYKADPFTVTSISAYRKSSSTSSLNIFRLDPHNPHIFIGPNGTPNDGSLFTQELRIGSPDGGRLDYTAGLFFSSQKTSTQPSPFNLHVHLPFPPFVIYPTGGINPGTYVDVSDESMAVFGQATFHATDQFRIIAGARYTGERLGIDYRSFNGLVTVRPKSNVENFSWRLGAQYEFDRNLMIYATASRGYKGPQIALGDPSVPNAPPPTVIRPEIPTSYETGLKATFADGKLALDLSGFYTRLKDYQGQQCIPLAAGGLQCVPQNISGVISKGIEVNLSGRPADHLTVNLGGIWNRVTYPSGFLGQDGSILGKQQLVNAPEWKMTASSEYSVPFGGAEGFLGADAVYKGKFRTVASTNPDAIYGGHLTLGGRIGIRSEDKNWSFAVFARNLTNNHEPIIRILNFPDGTGGVGQLLGTGSFRQVGISADVRF